MRRSDSSVPFDHETETRSDMTQEFWGESAGWAPSGERASRRRPRSDDTGSLRALRDGVAAFRPQRVELRDPSGEIRRTRSHRAPLRTTPTIDERRAQASIGELAAGHYDDRGGVPESDRDIELSPVEPVTGRHGLAGVDPLLARLGALVMVGVLLVPLALALLPSTDAPDTVRIATPDEQTSFADASGADVPASQLPTDVTTNAPATTATSSATTPSSAATAQAVEPGTPTSAQTAPVATDDARNETASSSVDESVGDVPQSAESGIDDGATVDATAQRIVPACPQTYEAAPGDSWYRIADAAGVTPGALLAENRATVDTLILPGDDICLPSGASMPTPPSTDAPTTTSPTTAPDTTTPATSAPTTTPSTTPAGSPGRDATVGEVKDVIRSIFPESEWDTAFMIVERESRFDPTAYNGWCCYGLFQIYWSVHRSWLDDYGITSSDDLFDPLLNVRAAHAIWQRAGNSWSPWSTYGG